MMRPADRTLRVAIVGAGLMGRWHAFSAARAGGSIVAVVDPDQARARRLASRSRAARAFSTLDGALERADVVHVCTPTAAHGAVIAQALDARRHVLVEKPLAATVAETIELLDRAKSHALLLCPVHQLLFQEGVHAALSSEVLAGLRHVDFTICSAGAQGTDDAAHDRIAIEILPHPVSLLIRMQPAFAEADWSVRHPRPGEIRALAQAGDVTATLLVSMSGRPPIHRMRLIGVRSAVDVDLFHGFAATLAGGVSRRHKVAQPYLHAGAVLRAATVNLARRSLRREPAYPGLRALVGRFYAAVRTGGAPPISAEETLAVARTCARLSGMLTGQQTR